MRVKAGIGQRHVVEAGDGDIARTMQTPWRRNAVMAPTASRSLAQATAVKGWRARSKFLGAAFAFHFVEGARRRQR